MNQNSWITSGVITSCKHKRELYKELQNNNATVASSYRDYSKILSRVIRKAKRIEYDKLILNSHIKVKTTWGIINKESGKNKNRCEIQAIKVEGKKSLINKPLLKLLMSILLLSQKMLSDKVKIIILMMIMIIWIVIPISWNKLLLNLTQVWNVNAQQQNKLNEL
jgi:hypothetical protein